VSVKKRNDCPLKTGIGVRFHRNKQKGDPRINIQKEGKIAKPYQVKLVLKALDKLEADNEN